MNIVLLGATGRTGRLVLELLLQAGHKVTTLGRREPEGTGFASLIGDVGDAATLGSALRGQDALVTCLQTPGDPPLCSAIARAASQAAPGLRYVSIGGAGVDQPGDRKGVPDKIVGWLLKRMQPAILADRQAEADFLATSRLDWTMLRPPMLTDDAPAGRYTLTYDRPAKLKISRGDLAQAVANAVPDRTLAGKAPFVSGP